MTYKFLQNQELYSNRKVYTMMMLFITTITNGNVVDNDSFYLPNYESVVVSNIKCSICYKEQIK